MSPGRGEQETRRSLLGAFRDADLSLEQLWLRYFALGGEAPLVEIEGYLQGLLSLAPLQHDMLAHALNERLDELASSRRAQYIHPVLDSRPSVGPLAALVRLLEGMHQAAPERLPSMVADAGAALGLQAVMYLVDYRQQTLAPLTAPGGPARRPLAVEGTLAGRAFREVRTLTSREGGVVRLWVPLLDGVERLGLLELVLGPDLDEHDPLLHDQCRWFSYLVGHLVTAVTGYGDHVDSVRRTRPRTPAAELIWHLLPPPTAGVGSFTVSGYLEPSEAVGGDVFDYALSESMAHLALFDATGHSLASGAVAAAALSAYRSTRRNRGRLYDQARAIDEVVAEYFVPEGKFVTGVLCEVDLEAGRVRYVVAGHPHPLILRQGKVVKTLDGGTRPLFGLPTAELTLGEEILQRGDWLVLFSDGIIEARDIDGRQFGTDRLVHFLQREAASGLPPPETVRRLVRAVMAHQNDVLQDDATVLIARWDGSDLSP
jgi:Stage II sporulation protein E (SpoIIE)